MRLSKTTPQVKQQSHSHYSNFDRTALSSFVRTTTRKAKSGRTHGIHPPAFNLANSPENLRSVRLFFTAIPIAFLWPMSTTSFLPRVIPV